MCKVYIWLSDFKLSFPGAFKLIFQIWQKHEHAIYANNTQNMIEVDKSEFLSLTEWNKQIFTDKYK